MPTTKSRSRKAKLPILSIPVLIACLVISLVLVMALFSSMKLSAESRARAQGETLLASLEQSITVCTNATDVLATVVRVEGGNVDDFDAVAQSLDTSEAPISSVQLAPWARLPTSILRRATRQARSTSLRIRIGLGRPSRRVTLGR